MFELNALLWFLLMQRSTETAENKKQVKQIILGFFLCIFFRFNLSETVSFLPPNANKIEIKWHEIQEKEEEEIEFQFHTTKFYPFYGAYGKTQVRFYKPFMIDFIIALDWFEESFLISIYRRMFFYIYFFSWKITMEFLFLNLCLGVALCECVFSIVALLIYLFELVHHHRILSFLFLGFIDSAEEISCIFAFFPFYFYHSDFVDI